MKKPSVINIKKFFVSLGLFDQIGEQKGVYDKNEVKDFDHLFVNISDISYNSVDALLLCSAEDAIKSIEKSTNLIPQKIKGFDSTIWRFTFPSLGYVSVEVTDKDKYITLDNGI